ncbi:MAG: biotin carboxyl carrier protein [Maribacter sp.]|jgi:biotin carboxyl carrier protein|tara:strand:- start:364 stop:846 length:483 start_codon:yes stop_codon:yes gene_type:complete
MEKYLIKVNEAEFDLSKDDVAALDMQNLGTAGFHVLKDNKSYDVQVIVENLQERRLAIAVNGNTYVIKINDQYDQLVQKMGLLSNTSQKAKNILAPMPGLIMDVMVQAGQAIEEGTPLLVLSAMKMENQILSQGGGTIRFIAIKVGDTVDKGQLIIEMES